MTYFNQSTNVHFNMLCMLYAMMIHHATFAKWAIYMKNTFLLRPPAHPHIQWVQKNKKKIKWLKYDFSIRWKRIKFANKIQNFIALIPNNKATYEEQRQKSASILAYCTRLMVAQLMVTNQFDLFFRSFSVKLSMFIVIKINWFTCQLMWLQSQLN